MINNLVKFFKLLSISDRESKISRFLTSFRESNNDKIIKSDKNLYLFAWAISESFSHKFLVTVCATRKS